MYEFCGAEDHKKLHPNALIALRPFLGDWYAVPFYNIYKTLPALAADFPENVELLFGFGAKRIEKIRLCLEAYGYREAVDRTPMSPLDLWRKTAIKLGVLRSGSTRIPEAVKEQELRPTIVIDLSKHGLSGRLAFFLYLHHRNRDLGDLADMPIGIASIVGIGKKKRFEDVQAALFRMGYDPVPLRPVSTGYAEFAEGLSQEFAQSRREAFRIV